MNMQTILGWFLIVFPGILYLGQVISSVNFPLAQRLGLQEDPAKTDPLVQRAEKYAAYWDLLTLAWMPIAGILMVVNHATWPLFALFAGAIYLDTAGREAAKYLSFKHAKLRLGSPLQQRLFFSTYLLMALLAIAALVSSVHSLYNGHL
ncbi:MAG: hypothetical protein ABW098_11940 [Candidatus Thiodiazotropha sp.]